MGGLISTDVMSSPPVESAQVSMIQNPVVSAIVEFLWTKSRAFPYSRMSTNITREITAYLGPHSYIYTVRGNRLRTYNWNLRIISELRLKSYFSDGTRFHPLQGENWLCIGGSVRERKVATLNVMKGTVLQRDNMQVPRHCPGLIVVDDFAYAFGGWPKLTSCEKMYTKKFAWKLMHNMQKAKAAFTPCLHGKDILLPDSLISRSVEVFHISTETYSLIDLTFPALQRFAVSFLLGSDLVLVSEQILAKWSIGSDTGFLVTELSSREARLNNSPPVKLGNSVLWMSCDTGELVALNMSRCTIREVI